MRKNKISVLVFCIAMTLSCSNSEKVTIVQQLPIDSTNDYYQANRAPLIPNPLIKLPIGSIEPAGWLRKKLEL